MTLPGSALCLAGWQGPGDLSHPCRLPGSALAGSWSLPWAASWLVSPLLGQTPPRLASELKEAQVFLCVLCGARCCEMVFTAALNTKVLTFFEEGSPQSMSSNQTGKCQSASLGQITGVKPHQEPRSQQEATGEEAPPSPSLMGKHRQLVLRAPVLRLKHPAGGWLLLRAPRQV